MVVEILTNKLQFCYITCIKLFLSYRWYDNVITMLAAIGHPWVLERYT